jgi:hypothetical protein
VQKEDASQAERREEEDISEVPQRGGARNREDESSKIACRREDKVREGE